MTIRSKRKGWKLQQDSLSKAIVHFKDKNTRTFYSYDWHHRYSKLRDQKLGLARLHKMITAFGTKAGLTTIYDIATRQRIARYYEGDPVDHTEDTY